MFAVIFTVQPKKERWNDYLGLAKYLKPKLEAVDGFIENERFESKRTHGRLLSLSTWRDEKAVVRWRTIGEHRSVQERGRFEIFEDYHLSVGEITRDSSPPQGIPVLEKRFDETEVGSARVASIVEFAPQPADGSSAETRILSARLGLDRDHDGLVDVEVFESIYTPGKILVLALWRDAAAANRWKPPRLAIPGGPRLRQVRIIRDYGMFDRREAPQFFREVQHAAPFAAK
jgi:heme-degrading monooxygenase HmoA